MTRVIHVTRTQVEAARASMEWRLKTGRPVPDATRRIAEVEIPGEAETVSELSS